jgi:hypothetical protein
MWRRLLAGLWRWWRADRIRAAPGEGRLLRLRPPCFLRVRGRTVEVLRRSVIHSVLGPCVLYCCCVPAGSRALLVAPQGGKMRWIEADSESELMTIEVEVFQLTTGAARD